MATVQPLVSTPKHHDDNIDGYFNRSIKNDLPQQAFIYPDQKSMKVPNRKSKPRKTKRSGIKCYFNLLKGLNFICSLIRKKDFLSEIKETTK